MPAQSTFSLFPLTSYPLVLTAVMIFAAWAGGGRTVEGRNGEPIKTRAGA